MTKTSDPVCPFVRVSNTLLRGVQHKSLCTPTEDAAVHASDTRFSSLRELGLYMMLSGLLSNPSFRTASGGMQQLLLGHCRNRYFSLHGAWKRLTADGWLKRARIPVGPNRFLDSYTLLSAPTATPSSVNLTMQEGKRYLAQHQAFVPPTDDFTMVSYPMLMDSRLSLSAKGLYALIARLLRISANHPELCVSKTLLRTMCGEGKNAFDGLFRELRSAGYLSLQRTWDAAAGKIRFLYVLTPCGSDAKDLSAADTVLAQDTTLEQDIGLVCETEKASPISEKRQEKAAAAKLDSKTPVSAAVAANESFQEKALSPQEARRAVEAQIEYPVLCADYPKERLDFIVSILSEGICGAMRFPTRRITLGADQLRADEIADRFLQLECEDIRYVLDTYEERIRSVKIRNTRKYLMTCLYHAKENFRMALDAFGSAVCGTLLPEPS